MRIMGVRFTRREWHAILDKQQALFGYSIISMPYKYTILISLILGHREHQNKIDEV